MDQCAAAPAGLESLLQSADPGLAAGPWVCSSDAAVSQAVSDFQGTVRQDGIGPGLRTYARTRDFLLYMDGQAPMALADANRHFTEHPIEGSFEETSRAGSADGSVAYVAGDFTDTKQGVGHAYVQLWQYEARVANWGLRILSFKASR